MQCTRELVENWHKHGVSPQELKNAKDKMIGSHLIASDTVDNLHSMVINSILQNKNPKQEFKLFEKQVQTLTLQQVNAAIRKYIDPTKMSSVVVGPPVTPSK